MYAILVLAMYEYAWAYTEGKSWKTTTTPECIGIWRVRWIVVISNFICRSSNSPVQKTHVCPGKNLAARYTCALGYTGPRTKLDFYVKSTNWKFVAFDSQKPFEFVQSTSTHNVLSHNDYFVNCKYKALHVFPKIIASS